MLKRCGPGIMWCRIEPRKQTNYRFRIQSLRFESLANRASHCLMQGTAREGCCTEWKSQGKIHKFTKILADLYHRTPAKDTTEWCVKQVHSQSPRSCKRPSSSTCPPPMPPKRLLGLSLRLSASTPTPIATLGGGTTLSPSQSLL